MYWILAIATLLGGLAAIGYFWDKLTPLWSRRTQPSESREPEIKWVDTKYPEDSGLKAKLETDGYAVAWSAESKLARRVDLQGAEVVVDATEPSNPIVYKVQSQPSNLVLIRWKVVGTEKT